MDLGHRLTAQERRLRLLLAHLAGPALRSRVELEDLVQEVYLRALDASDHAPDAEGSDARLFGWLRVLARRTVVDAARALRAAKRDGAVRQLAPSSWSRAGLGSRVADPGPGPATALAEREAERTLVRAFHALSPEHRRVLGLRQFEGLSATETAERMGRSASAVHSLYRRALSAWERVLSSDGSAGETSSGFGGESEHALRPDSHEP